MIITKSTILIIASLIASKNPMTCPAFSYAVYGGGTAQIRDRSRIESRMGNWYAAAQILQPGGREMHVLIGLIAAACIVLSSGAPQAQGSPGASGPGRTGRSPDPR